MTGIRRFITRDDFSDTFAKLKQRGLKFILSKFNTSGTERTRSAFNEEDFDSSDYWIIPAIRRRWNKLITGDENLSFEYHLTDKYFKNRSGLKLLSLGSGSCSHELILAAQPCFSEVTCIDFSEQLLAAASKQAEATGLRNMQFKTDDVNKMSLEAYSPDVILFHSSLHHFKDVKGLLDKTRKALKPDGILVLIEYVGPARLQFPKQQIAAMKRILKDVIPETYKKRYKSKAIKKAISGPGYLRMLVADPSEGIESDRIITNLRKNFLTLEEKNIGGDLTALLFKDIAHNFLKEDEQTNNVLNTIFSEEDKFIGNRTGDFIFGVYQPKRA